MLNPKKHPLEIFRERRRQGPLLSRDSSVVPGASGRNVNPATPSPPGASAEVPERAGHPRWEPTEFELRLSLGSTVLVAMTWIVLLAAAYVLGVSNGREQQLLVNDQTARARGAEIEQGSAEALAKDAAGAPQVAATAWYGVQLASYPAPIEKFLPLITELKDSLAKRYGENLALQRTEIEHWVFSNGTSAVFAGCFESKDDPKLIQLAANLRKIGDWPVGDKSPFRSAEIAKLPDGQLAKRLGLTRSKPGD